jgi:hypothetical protein
VDLEGASMSGGRADAPPWLPADRIELLVVLGRAGAWAIREGFACEPLRGAGLRAAGAVCVELAGAPLCAAWTDAQGAARALARSRLYAAGLLLGTMRASSDFPAYARQRRLQRPIAHHQALAFLSSTHAAVEATRGARRPGDSTGADARGPRQRLPGAAEQAMFVTRRCPGAGRHGFQSAPGRERE